MATELNDENFPQFVRESRAAFVHFWASWNGYDLAMKAVIDRVEPDYLGRVAFGTVDVDLEATRAICAEHRVLGPPFFAYYRAGQLTGTKLGMLSEQDLRDRLNVLISEGAA